MNELNKLIQQYETENPDKKAAYRFQNMNHWGGDFVLWLASRPTCGVEQRKFLDEIREKFYYNKEEQGLTNQGNEYDILYQDTFTKCNLQELMEGKG